MSPGTCAAGGSGWESWIVYSRPGTSGYGGAGGWILPGIQRPRTPSSAAVAAIFGELRPLLRRGNTVAYVLTGPQVWAVRIGSRTIRTITSPALPSG